MLNVGLEQQQQIRGADGTILWAGGQVIANSFIITCTAGASGTGTVGAGEGVIFDATASVIPRMETTAAGGSPSSDLPMSLDVRGSRTPAAANANNFLGVAQEPIAVGKRGFVASTGSLCAVQTTATLLGVGTFVGSSATVGLVAVLAAASAANISLGAVFKINQVASPGTGSTGWAGILVGAGTKAA